MDTLFAAMNERLTDEMRPFFVRETAVRLAGRPRGRAARGPLPDPRARRALHALRRAPARRFSIVLAGPTRSQRARSADGPPALAAGDRRRPSRRSPTASSSRSPSRRGIACERSSASVCAAPANPSRGSSRPSSPRFPLETDAHIRRAYHPSYEWRRHDHPLPASDPGRRRLALHAQAPCGLPLSPAAPRLHPERQPRVPRSPEAEGRAHAAADPRRGRRAQGDHGHDPDHPAPRGEPSRTTAR